MTSIYEQHEAAFSRVAAYTIAKDGERVATVAFKFPADGAGRLYAYVHWFGVQMVRGYASGYGYDKRSAACSDASHKIVGDPDAEAFVGALTPDDGRTWASRLENAGFTVWQAV